MACFSPFYVSGKITVGTKLILVNLFWVYPFILIVVYYVHVYARVESLFPISSACLFLFLHLLIATTEKSES